MSTRTTWPRRPLGVNGGELSQPVAPAREGKFPSTGNCAAAPMCCPVESIIPSPATAMHIAPMTRERRRRWLASSDISFSFPPCCFLSVDASGGRWRTGAPARPCPFDSAFQERQKLRVDLIRVSGGQTMRSAGIVDLLRALDQLGRFFRRVFDWNDLVVFTVQHESGHVEFLQILRLVRFGKRLDAFVGVQETRLHAPEPELIEHSLRNFGPGTVGAVERRRQVLPILGRILE